MLCRLQVTITPALSALYDEAVAFSKQYAAEQGISTADQASSSCSSSQGHAAAAAAACGGEAGAEAAGGGVIPAQPPGGLGPRSLFELMARQVCQGGLPPPPVTDFIQDAS
jgi:hypothetical protein